MKRWLFATALSFVFCAAPSFAQSPPPSIGAAVLGGQTTLAVSTVTANVQLTAANPPYNAITVYNYGANDVYFSLGGSTVTATTGSTLLKAGNYLTVWVNGVSQTYLAAITGSSTSNLVIYQATGAVLIGSNSSGGSGGTVTAIPSLGTPSQSSVTVTNSSTALTTASQFSKFGKACVAYGSAAGAWVNWAGAAAVTASPSEHLAVGQCAYWTAFVPTSIWNAISDTPATNSTMTVEGN